MNKLSEKKGNFLISLHTIKRNLQPVKTPPAGHWKEYQLDALLQSSSRCFYKNLVMFAWMLNKNLLTVGPQQHCSGPQTSEQLAVAAAWVQVELVCVTGLPDPLRLLHPDKNSPRRRDVLLRPEQEKKNKIQASHVIKDHLSDISWTLVWNRKTGRKSSLVSHVHHQDAVIHPIMIPTHPDRNTSLTASCGSGVCVSMCTRPERVCDRLARAWLQWALWVRRHCSTRSSSLCTCSKRRCSSSSRASRAALTWARICSLALLAAVCTEEKKC